MGYHPIAMPVRGFPKDAVIKMTEAPLLLNEIVITDKPITVDYIFKSIKANLRKNYPVDAYGFECFYREIKKEDYRYKSLLEAAQVVTDKGYDQQKSEIAFLREIRWSNKYVNRFSEFFQTNNLWRETMGLNAVRHPTNRPSFFGKDKYLQPQPFFGYCHDHVSTHCNPNLCLHCVGRCPPKGLDFQMLLYPFEKQFNLPTVLVEGRYVGWFALKIIGQEDEHHVVFRVQVF